MSSRIELYNTHLTFPGAQLSEYYAQHRVTIDEEQPSDARPFVFSNTDIFVIQTPEVLITCKACVNEVDVSRYHVCSSCSCLLAIT